MTSSLLQIKVHLPPRRAGLVPRPRLLERLNRGAASALTLVSAPAGFGKTTLLAQWLADGRSAAWVSLDHRDNNPVVFWTYLITAIKTATGGVGAGALSLLQSPQPQIDDVVANLLNDVNAAPEDLLLVLDDYHVIDAQVIHDGIAFVLEHLPPRAHMVIVSRADPALPLARLRARGELIEIRAAELRFEHDEATAYLNETMGLLLTAHDVAALEGRTEGWIAALQLAALSMQGRDDVTSFIAGFAGDDRYIVDYLAEEVLARQPQHVQQFLLSTSILDRLSGPLCDAVTGQGGGKAKLTELERGNLFLIPLDDRRRWYRYHQLFADVLQAHLLDEQPDVVPELHRRASAWFDQNSEPAEAIRHALAGRDFARAAELVELAMPSMRKNRQETLILSWLPLLPEELVRNRPVLNVGFAGALLANGNSDDVEGRLRNAELLLAATAKLANGGTHLTSTSMVVADEEEFHHLPGMIASYRAALALAAGDLAGTLMQARKALDVTAPEDLLARAAAAALIGLASWTIGDLEAGHQGYTDCVAGLRRAGHIADTFGCAVALADIRIAQGHLGDAMRTYEHTLEAAADPNEPVLRGTADMFVGMSALRRERDDLTGATEDLQRSEELGEHLGLPQNRYRWRVAMARIREAEGDPAGAIDLLNDAERLYTPDFFPNLRPVPAMRARVWVTLGRSGDALGWARERRLSVDDDLSYLHEFDQITLARVLLGRPGTSAADSSVKDAARLLGRLREAAEDGGRIGSVIEILALQGCAHQRLGHLPDALESLERAVTLAEPEDYVRVFVDEGRPMAGLLRALGKQQGAARYLRRLLAAFETTTAPPAAEHGLIDPLSERELAVLRLLGSDLDGPGIARELVVTLNTLRTHTNHIYAKLGVNNRRAAVRRGQQLDLLSANRSR